MKKVSDSQTIPEAVQFYAELGGPIDDDESPIVRAFEGIQLHFRILLPVLDEVRDPGTLIAGRREDMLKGVHISLQRLCEDMAVIQDYAIENLARDPRIVQKITAQNAAEKAQTVQ